MARRTDAVRGWLGRAWRRRQARLSALRRPDEYLTAISHSARDAGEPYDRWRQTLPVARRCGGL